LWLKPGKVPRSLTYPGALGVSHAWAYLPDLAQALIRLMQLDDQQASKLAAFEVVHFAGHGLVRADAMPRAVALALGHPDMRITGLPWWLMRALAPVVPFFRELVEMRYLWQVPLLLDNHKLVSLIGAEPHTRLDQAVRASLRLGASPPEPTLQPASAG
jgi:nucleoside-diphosphate-sugar epimerase